MVPFPVILEIREKKISVGDAKYVLHTVNTYPSPEVFPKDKDEVNRRDVSSVMGEYVFLK